MIADEDLERGGSDLHPIVCPACERPVTHENARFCAECGHRFASPSLERADERFGVADPLIGHTLADRYLISEVIGRGGMGVVYRVEHTRIGKAMAMKLLHGELARDRAVVRRFRREAETASKLDHPNTVQIFDFGQSGGLTFLVMELLSGEDLGEILHSEGTVSFSRIAHIAAQVSGSVAQAHERGIVHRDLKPENIRILHDRGTPDFAKVLDFGLAKLRSAPNLAGASITRHGMVVGTPYYMAPEQIRGEPVDARADVYSMGCLLYKSVVGVPPFWASTPIAVLTRHLTDEAAPPSRRSPRRDLDPDVDRIILRAMAKEPAHRYGSMRELRADLEEYLRARGLEPSSTTPRSPTPSVAAPLRNSFVEAHTIEVEEPTREHAAVAATRDEVERFERRLRLRAFTTRLMLLTLFAGAALGGAYAWTQRDEQASAPSNEEREPNDDPARADALTEGVRMTAQLGRRLDPARGDEDLFAIDVPSGVEQVALHVSALPNVDLAVDVFTAQRGDPIVTLDSMPLGGPEAAPNLPLGPGRYLARVREVRVPGRFPIENVSDSYTIEWARSTREPSDEREWNDTRNQADALEVGGGEPTIRTGFIGWGGDVDTYCLEAVSAPLTVTSSGIETLDLALDALFDDREQRFDEGGLSEGERGTIPGAREPRRVCIRVSAAPTSVQHGDARRRYELRVEADPHG